MSRQALPFRTPPPDCVDAEDWVLLTGHDAARLPDAIPDWDYQMDLRVQRRVRVDLSRLRREAHVPMAVAFNLVVVWSATGSNLRAPAHRARLDGSDPQMVNVSAHLPGAKLGGRLTLETALVLADPVLNGSTFSAHRPGTVLWNDHHSVRLQGDAPQFPMAVIDFAKTSFPDDAGWHLQVGGNLHAATMGTLLLLINERNTVTAGAFRNAGQPRPVDRVVLSTVYADVGRTMIEHALREAEFTDESQFSDGTLGATMAALIRRLFPGRSINDLRLRMEQSPSLFASEIQDAIKIFKEV